MHSISLQVRGSSGGIGVEPATIQKLQSTPSEEDRVDRRIFAPHLLEDEVEEETGLPYCNFHRGEETAGNWSPASKLFVSFDWTQRSSTNLLDVEEEDLVDRRNFAPHLLEDRSGGRDRIALLQLPSRRRNSRELVTSVKTFRFVRLDTEVLYQPS